MEFLERFDLSPELIRWTVLGAVAFGLGSLVVLPLLVLAIPQDYFFGPASPPTPWAARHPFLHASWRVLRNVLGFFMVLLGVVMIVTPGQGLLTILVGLMLLEFPGKRRIEQRLVARPSIHRHLNRIRGLARRPPLTLPELDPPGSQRAGELPRE